MTAIPYPQSGAAPGTGRLRQALLAVVVAGLLLISLRLPWPSRVPPFRAQSHAEQRHGKESVPPEMIRSCILGGAFLEFSGVDGTPSEGKIARLCRYAVNQVGLQIGWFSEQARDWTERTAFYGTVCRIFRIVTRDHYVLSNTSDPALYQQWLAFTAGQLCQDPATGN